MRGLKRAAKKLALVCYSFLAHVLPVRKRTVVFMSSLGRNYTGNPRAVCEKMAELGLTGRYRCYYIFDEPGRFKAQLPPGVRALKNARLRYYAVMAAAGIWVSDTRFQNYMIKRKKTVYIQTWHGTPLKKLGLDLDSLHMAGGATLEEYKEAFRKNAATWDYLLSQNPFSSEVFRRAFDFRGTMLEIGYPRNDRLVRAAREENLPDGEAGFAAAETGREPLRGRLGLPPGRRVMLYAPTWRDDAFYSEEDYRFETELDFGKMQQAFGKEYVLVVKYHYMVREHADWNRYPGFVYTAADDVDIAELYLISDLLITDYSSVMFDYSLLKRPMYFFAYDLENYRDALRGFYFDFEEEAPGPVVTTTDGLIAAIAAGEACGERRERFCAKYNPYDDGHAAEKVIEIMKGIN